MTDKKLTDSEIIKALEYWKKFDNEIDQMLSGRFKDNKILIEQKEIVKITLNLFDLINRQKAIIEKSEKVEHFADKTIETANAEIENLKVENQSLRSAANSLKMHYEEAQAENERLKNILICFMGALGKVRNIDDIESISQIPIMTELNKGIRAEIKAEAYKECIEKVRKLAVGMHPCSDELRVFDNDLDNLLKELMGENND